MSATAPHDEELVRRAQQGDRVALVVLYRRYVKEVYGFALNRLGRIPDAEDITSETFLRMVAGLDSFRSQSSFRTWLYSIARNQLRDHWRRNGRRPQTVSLDGARLQLPATAPAASESPRATALGRLVLDRLPINYRRVIEMRILEGRSVRDTAEALQISEGNVKVLQHRGLKRAEEIAEGLWEHHDEH